MGMPFSKQEWYDLEIPISTQTSVQFEESGKSPEDLFRETQTAKSKLDPLLLCTSTQPGLGEVNAYEKGDSLKFVTQAKKELTVESAMWAATGYGPLSFLLRPEKEALAAVLSSDLELKNGQLALKVRASPRPDLAALVAPKTAAPDMGLKLRPSLDFAPGGDHAYKPPHVNEEDTPRTKAQNDPRAHALLHTPEAERPKSKSISRAASLTPPRSKDGKVDRGTGASRPTSAATTRKPRRQGKAETMTMEEIRRPITPGVHEGPATDRSPPVLKQSDDLSVVEEKSHFTPDPTPVVTELPLQKIKKEPPQGPVLLKAKTQSGEKIEVYEEGEVLVLYMPKTGDAVTASENEWYQIGYGALYELTPAEKRSLADACEIDMRGQVDANTTRGVLVLRLDARVHGLVEEQRGYDDTRKLPQQSSMFGEHAEAPVVEPLFGSVEERQQEDERVAAVVVPARAARKKAEEEARQAEEDARREAEHAEAERLEAERVEAEKLAKEEAERKEREKQEMLERKAAEKAEAKRRA